MKSSLCEDWSAEIRPEQYFSEHFLNHEQNLAKELVQALENGLSKNTPIFSKIIDYVKRTPLTTNDLLDSLFKLRDVIIQPTGKPGSSIEPSGKYTLKRNIEIAITQLSRLFERYDLDVQDQIIDQVHQLSTEGYLIELDKEFRILNLNQPLLQKFNYEKEEILGSPFSMLFSQPSQSLITYAQQQLSEKRRLSIELDVEAVTKPGHNFKSVIKAYRRESNNSDTVFTAELQDFSHQQETKNILSLMLRALESVGEGILIIEPTANGRILFVNRALENLSGYQRQQLFGKPFSILWGEYYDPEVGKEIFEHSLQEGWNGEITQQNRDGSPYSVYLDTQPVQGENGSTVAMVGIERDVTKEKEHQQQILNLRQFIEQIINNLQNYIFVTEKDFIIKFWNKSLEKESHTPANQAIGQPLQNLFPELKSLVNDDTFQEELKQNHIFSQKKDWQLFTKEKRYYHLIVTPLFPQKLSGPLLWVLEDIHEEELRKKQITWQNTRLQFLQNLSNILNATLDIRKSLFNFSEELDRIFPYDAMNVLLPVDSNKRNFRIFFSSKNYQKLFSESLILNFNQLSVFSPFLAKKKQRFFSFTVNEFPQNAYFDTLKQHGIQCLISFPIIFSGELIGILNLGHRQLRHYTEEEFKFLEQIISHLTVAIKNCTHFDQIEKQNQKLNLIHQILSFVRNNLPLNSILPQALIEIGATFSYHHLAIYRVIDKQNWELLAEHSGPYQSNISFPEFLEINDSLPDFPRLWIDTFSAQPFDQFVGRQLSHFTPKTALWLKETTAFHSEIIMIAFCNEYLPDLSYSYHVNIMQAVLKELTLALDHLFLFQKTLQAEEEWKTTFNQVSIGLAVVDEKCFIKRANKAFWELFLPDDPMPAQPVHWDVLLQSNSDCTGENSSSEALQNGKIVEWKDPPSGKILTRQFFRLDDKVNPFKGGIVIVQDVTDSRKREEHIRYLSRFPEINPNFILSLSNTGEIRYYNPASYKLLESLELSTSKPEALIPVTLLFEIQNDQFRPGVANEYIHNLKDRVFQFVAFMPEEDDNIYLYGLEITERLDLQNRLIQTERIRAMGEMAAGVAHDFNNLLTTILGRTQLMLFNTDEEKLTPELHVIEKAAKDGAQIVRRMQELNREKREQAYQNVYLSEILHDSLLYSTQKLKPETQVKGQQTHIHTDFNKDLVVSANPIEMKEVFTNLIFNAFDAMPEGGELFLQTRKKDEHTACAIVRDTGIGMPVKIQKNIFDPFFTTKGERGTGLGLSLVYKIVTAHQGRIHVNSEDGKGTEFVIELPLSEQEPVQDSEKQEPQFNRLGDIRLLVVDDEPELLETIAEVLKLKFKEVEMAYSGKEALQKIDKRGYDVILTDLGMPEMSGWEVARAVKNKLPQSRVILVTGWGMQAEEELKNHDYVDQIISKPYDLHNLITVIEHFSLQE